jgi:hypothetical protein
MVADVAAMKSRLNEFQRQRQNIVDDEVPRTGWTRTQGRTDEEQSPRTGWTRTQGRTDTELHQDNQHQALFPASQAEPDNCVPTQDTPVRTSLSFVYQVFLFLFTFY